MLAGGLARKSDPQLVNKASSHPPPHQSLLTRAKAASMSVSRLLLHHVIDGHRCT